MLEELHISETNAGSGRRAVLQQTTMAATSMMKEYVKRQLKYWVDNFKDDQLPRDFNSKSFARPQLTLHKITLKPDKIAALLHVPAPLIVTRATCSELTLKVPSWQLAEKFVQEPLSLRLGDLFVDVKHIDECDEHVRRDSVARARASSMEPDPLGSIASMYQFATVISERLELQVETVSLKLYVQQALRVRVEMSRFHARTTNALWQDMRDLTDCVDRSPDGLLKTRFKFVSAQCSVYLHDGTAATATADKEPPPIRLLRDHAIAMRVTLFGHRKNKQDNWQVLSRVVDLNLETLPFDLDTAQVRQVYALCATLARWRHEAATDSGGVDGLLPHQMVRGPLTPTRKPTNPPNGGAATEQEEEDQESGNGTNTFALQVTVRFTAHVLLRVRSARRNADVQLAVIAQHAALNWIQHDHAPGQSGAATEIQLTVHDLSVRHKEKVLFHVKPARDVLQVKRLPGPGANVFVKWHLQKLECRLEKELAELANELFHSLNELEQAATITCGTCHHRIRLDAIETHVCSARPSSPSSTNGSRHGSSDGASAMDVAAPASAVLLDSTRMPKLRFVLALDELEVVTDSFLFRSVQDLARLAAEPPREPAQRFTVTIKDWSVSTESKEFVGDAIFVPVLPLAFQMLECTIRGCGCVHRQQAAQTKRHRQDQADEPATKADSGGHSEAADDHVASVDCALPRWPDRVFAELGHLALRTTNNATKTETFLCADGASLRLSFSDGQRVCRHSTPQMSCYFHVERIRCQVEHDLYERVRSAVAQLQDPLEGHAVVARTLFFAVMEIRNIELTLLDAATASARIKAQFRHVGGVADNHHGRLALQTNFDFRALVQSEAVTFDFTRGAEPTLGEETPHAESPPPETKRERRRRRQETLRVASAQQIQRVFRSFVAERRRQLDQELRRLTREDEETDLASAALPLRVVSHTLSNPSLESDVPTVDDARPRRGSGSKPMAATATALLSAAGEDLAAINPLKMVAAAGVLKDGVLGFVKAKQQMLESEMTDFAHQSKESASRFIPKYSAVKNLLSPKTASGSAAPVALSTKTPPPTTMEELATTKNAELRNVEDGGSRREDTELAVPAEVAGARSNGASSRASSRVEVRLSESHNHHQSESEGEEERVEKGDDEVEAGEQEHEEDQDELPGEDGNVEDQGQDAKQASSVVDDDNVREEEGADDEKVARDATTDETPRLSEMSASEALLASLPTVVRLLVQVEEHRLCVPIDPRAPVSALCREIVRRFNEMFAQHGVIAHVVLQNPQGAVLAGSDIVALVCDTAAAARDTLLYAYPHAEDAVVKSVVRVGLSSTAEGDAAPGNEAATGNTGSFHGKPGASTAAFSRCSKLPLPLVVALLANESERDLLRQVLQDGARGTGDEWPELALNTSFLDPARDMLQVEVRWPGGATQSLGVANRDAFLLCLQQLGLCTSRENSKHVGKVLRDRLKMDPKNPLIRMACLASPEFQHDMARASDETNDPPAVAASYDSLKEIVQEDFGVYTHSRAS